MLKMWGICRSRSYLLSILIFDLFFTKWCCNTVKAEATTAIGNSGSCGLDAVIMTTGKDGWVFEKSIQSSIKHFLDVRKYYIISPNPQELIKKYSDKPWYSDRIVVVGEETFPFSIHNITTIMFKSVAEKGLYQLTGSSPFEHAVWVRPGWYLQQLLKLYAGKVLGLGDYILLDSDLIWFNDVNFTVNCDASSRQYYYASSRQYHAAYMASISKISGVPIIQNVTVHRSGIVHHMVIIKSVVDDLMMTSEKLHNGLPFWQIMLNASALEMTCFAPNPRICGSGTTLSEYELYLNYARVKHPATVQFRPLLWTNGPSPGLLFYPKPGVAHNSDGQKGQWMPHKQNEVPEVFEKQIEADKLQGYDYVGYHSYAKRRYNELVGEDYGFLCKNATPPPNSTCSWRGYEEAEDSRLKNNKGIGGVSTEKRTAADYFKGCACHMIAHQSS